jgi:hypothetical protein
VGKAFITYSNPNNTEKGIMWLCPGCGEYHSVPTEGHQASWKFDGNMDKPTLSPSVRVRGGSSSPDYCCHFFIRKGIAEFCGDCSHDNAGKKMEVLPDETRGAEETS